MASGCYTLTRHGAFSLQLFRQQEELHDYMEAAPFFDAPKRQIWSFRARQETRWASAPCLLFSFLNLDAPICPQGGNDAVLITRRISTCTVRVIDVHSSSYSVHSVVLLLIPTYLGISLAAYFPVLMASFMSQPGQAVPCFLLPPSRLFILVLGPPELCELFDNISY